MKKRIVRKIVLFTAALSISMIPTFSVLAENSTESQLQSEILVEEEKEVDIVVAEDIEDVQIPIQKDELEEISTVDDTDCSSETESSEFVIEEIEEIQLIDDEGMLISEFVDEQPALFSSSSSTINIQDDNGYLWNGYYNADGTITINGTQQLWGNAKTDNSSVNNDALIIPASIGGKTVTAIGGYNSTASFGVLDKRLIRKIVLPKTVTTADTVPAAGTGLFGGFTNLEELDLGGVYVDSERLFGYAASNHNTIPLKKLTLKDLPVNAFLFIFIRKD